MKCDKCSKEAIFHYESNVNGKKSEYHLCEDCAKQEGFGNMFDFRPDSMFQSFWNEPFGGLSRGFSPFAALTNGFFTDPFPGFFGRSLMAPVMSMPQVRIMVGEPEAGVGAENATETAERKMDNIPKDAGEEIRAKRELLGLKHQLKSAVHNEEFERAAELRDKIRAIENK